MHKILLLVLIASWTTCGAADADNMQSGELLTTSTSVSTESGRQFQECKVCPQMIILPPGNLVTTKKIFADAEDKAAAPHYTSPPHKVTISAPFALGLYPVTRGEYAAFVRETNRVSADGCKTWRGGPEWTEGPGHSWSYPGFMQTDRHPVVCVSWEDAQEYIRWLNGKAQGFSRFLSDGNGPYRLPSFDEAEYAARANSSGHYYWGDAASRDHANYGDDTCSPCRGARGGRDQWIRTSPVGAFPANGFDLFDMAGNVWEMTATPINEAMRESQRSPATANSMLLIGGSWLDKPERMAIGDWMLMGRVDHVQDVGFRVARTLTAAAYPDSVEADSAAPSSETSRKAATDGPLTKVNGFRDCLSCPEMVAIPPGSFYYGAKERFPKDWPPVLVKISRPIAIGKYPVTRDQYAIFVKETRRSGGPGCQVNERGQRWHAKDEAIWSDPGFKQTGRDPVVCVSWDDAHAYIEWLNKRSGADDEAEPGHGRYRLPSGEEWEYAARAGAMSTGVHFYWGNIASHNYTNFGLDVCCGGKVEGRDRWIYTSPVGSFSANPFGLFDMYGNVWQFTDDCFNEGDVGLPTDGSAWTNGGDCRYRIARGGSWDDEASALGVFYLNAFGRDVRNYANGFRVVRDMADQG